MSKLVTMAVLGIILALVGTTVMAVSSVAFASQGGNSQGSLTQGGNSQH